jgi:hypothetical protein
MWERFKLKLDTDTLINIGVHAGIVLLIPAATFITVKLVKKAFSKKGPGFAGFLGLPGL